jgi:hypothetical protein
MLFHKCEDRQENKSKKLLLTELREAVFRADDGDLEHVYMLPRDQSLQPLQPVFFTG